MDENKPEPTLTKPEPDLIKFEDFAKVQLKVGKILEAAPAEGSEKLIKLKVDIGEDEPRQIFAGIVKWYTPEELIGKNVIVVANLEPKRMMNSESQGMLLAADTEEKPILLTTSEPVSAGAKIR